jgi:transposase InsO family protein
MAARHSGGFCVREQDERRAVFWCSLLRPLLYDEIPCGRRAAFLRELAAVEVVFPDGRRRKPSVGTLRRMLRKYRRKGFTALARKVRSDQGRIRVVPGEVLQTAIEAKRALPTRSPVLLNLLLEQRHGKRMARSTLYRHLKAAGATRFKLGVAKEPVHKSWGREHTHDLWLGDFSNGPCVLHDGLATLTYLSIFIDIFSRYVVAGRYYLQQTFDVLCDTLIRAVGVHGLPLALYLDNAKVYWAHSLLVFCDRMQVQLLHRPPRDPAPGGVVERVIQTAQTQFEPEVRASGILTLEELNRGFNAWLEVCYHGSVHSETGATPADRYKAGLSSVRTADMQAVAESFLQREERTVDKTYSDIQLHGRLYRVDAKLRGDRLEVAYDPFGTGEKVWLYTLRGEYLGEGRLHRREAREEAVLAPGPASRTSLLNVLIEKQKQLHASERGVDFRGALAQGRWPFPAFAACLAGLLGRSGGLSAFSGEELAALQQVHARQGALTRTLLKKACEKATHKTIPSIIHALQTLKEED